MEFAIVLTGTIIPNTILVSYENGEERRRDYLIAIEYYRKFSPVFFLENSTYDVGNDKEFHQYDNVFIRKFPVSKFQRKGKGFQEFEMIDRWIKSEKNLPARWIKITGRYIIRDFINILNDTIASDKRRKLIMDIYRKRKSAITALFYIESTLYKNIFMNAYKECDDIKGYWIERVLFKKIYECKDSISCRMFLCDYQIEGRSGSTGDFYTVKNKFEVRIRMILRRMNYYINSKFIFF